MRTLDKPGYDFQNVYKTCTNSISSHELVIRLLAITDDIVAAANNYNQKAQANNLFLIIANNNGNDQIVVGDVTKKELKNLYSQQMVGATKPARYIYDELIGSAPHGKCPFCGFGQASTLDHYLPKAKYPCLSILPLNLIPACKDCNKGKGTSVAISVEQQVLHPYYDHFELSSNQWLFASVQETHPASINYYVSAPEHWSDISKQRVKTHFIDFELASRFSIEAANELSSLSQLLSDHVEGTRENAVKEYLLPIASVEYGQNKNSWRTAMYQALAASDWYCNGGYS